MLCGGQTGLGVKLLERSPQTEGMKSFNVKTGDDASCAHLDTISTVGLCAELRHHCLTSLLCSPDTRNNSQPPRG